MSGAMMCATGDSEEIRSELRRLFAQRRKDRARNTFPQDLAMIGLLFARPTDPFAKQNILPELDYFSSRSGHHIDFFCVGYTRTALDKKLQESLPTITIKNQKWWFDNIGFDKVRGELERDSKWKYSGGTDLVLANARSAPAGNYIDCRAAISCSLEQMQSDKAFNNVREFFEKIFKYAETPNAQKPTYGLSDDLGKGVALSAIKKMVFRLLPEGLADDYAKARHFVVTDFTKKTT
jgi:hypothetical protein